MHTLTFSWPPAGPGRFLTSILVVIIFQLDQSHWQIYLLQSLFHITKSLLICIALFGNLPKFRKEKAGKIIIRYLNMLSSYWRTLGGCDNMTSVPPVSSSSHSSLFTPVIQPSSRDSWGQWGCCCWLWWWTQYQCELHTLAAIVTTFRDHTSSHVNNWILAGCFLSSE